MDTFTLGGSALPRALSAIALSVCNDIAITAEQLDCKWEAWALSNSKSTALPSESEFRDFVHHLRQKALQASASKSASKHATKSASSVRVNSLLHPPAPTPTRATIDDFFNYVDDDVKQEALVKNEPQPLVSRDLSQQLDQPPSQPKRSRLLKHESTIALVKPHAVNRLATMSDADVLQLPGDNQHDDQYANRSGSGRLEASLDNSDATPHHPMPAHLRGPVHVQLLTEQDYQRTRYMNNTVSQRINHVRAHMQTVIERILERVKQMRVDEMPPLSSTTLLEESPATVLIAGRVRTELEETDASSKAPINTQSVVLENEDGHRIKLNLKRLIDNKHPFFINPGMFVVVEGVNTNGRLFDVHAIYDNAMQTPAKRCVSNDKHNVKMEVDDGLPMEEDDKDQFSPAEYQSQPYANLLVAAGPFSRPSNLKYEPLADLLQITERTKPDVVILLGPFVSESHQHISAQTTVSFDEIFATRIITPLQDTVERMMAESGTAPQFVLVPALDDVHHDFVCPQPAFRWPFEETDANIQLCPNPSVLRVSATDGQHVSFVGASSLPTLLDMSADSLCVNKQDRLGSIVSHMLRQRSFYPTFPPGSSVPLDTSFLDRLGIMDVDTGDTIDMIVVPSKLQAFAKSVDGGAIAVNPGLASPESNGGTYAEIALPLHSVQQVRAPQANEDKIEIKVLRL